MDDVSGAQLVQTPMSTETSHPIGVDRAGEAVVSTHVLVPEEQAMKLKELSRRTRIAQSEYLREAVDDLLTKYGRKPEDGK